MPNSDRSIRHSIRHPESHHVSRTGWLRAAVLGANDGILSTASLILGVAEATHSSNGILVSGISGLVAGALSMAAGEYVSVSSQSDAEKAELEQERHELAQDKEGELRELTEIYVKRGLKETLAAEVAKQLSRKDALAAHARDELGLSEEMRARPTQAALASAMSFSAGAAIPVAAGMIAPIDMAVAAIYATSLIFLIFLGALGAKVGGAPMLPASLRVAFWGAFAMAVTAGIGSLFHVTI
jgi:VIT1/CCC1 family predicted Fe2+/Mn2+ transporter